MRERNRLRYNGGQVICAFVSLDHQGVAMSRTSLLSRVLSIIVSVVMVVSMTPIAWAVETGETVPVQDAVSEETASDFQDEDLAGTEMQLEEDYPDEADTSTQLEASSGEQAFEGEIVGSFESQTYQGPDSLDNEALFESYIEAKLATKNSPVLLAKRGAVLSGVNQAVYNKLKPEITKVADGIRSSTVFEVSVEDFGLEKLFWTAEELGVPSLFGEDNEVTEQAINALVEKVGFDIDALMRALLANCPYDLYWYDKVAGVSTSSLEISTASDGSEWLLGIAGSMELSFSVAQGYAAGQYQVDTTHAERVQHAVAKAASIVEAYKDKTDAEKLAAYRVAICDLVEYDTVAAEDESAPYGDSWQVISVFDEDLSTNVVCEGYSKAFQYLCDLTDFEGEIDCISVTGTMSGGTGAGAHMWNIVNLADGKNYLVDVTNCDEGSIGEGEQLFLATASSGDMVNGYSFACIGGNIDYVYDSDTFATFSEEDLAIAYGSDAYSGACGCDAFWELDDDGVLTITGAGEVTNPQWIVLHKDKIMRVVIAEGITELGDCAFEDCTNLVSVSLPSSLSVIGSYAFFNTGLTNVVLPEGVRETSYMAFSHCSALVSVSFPTTLESMKDEAFSHDVALQEVVLQEQTYVGRYAFTACTGLKRAVIDGDIAEGAFCNCANLRTVELGPSISSIDKVAFSNCESIESVVMPDSVTALGESVFSNCSSLTSVRLSSGLTVIPDSTFYYCESLTDVTMGESVSIIGPGAFMECHALKSMVLPENVTEIQQLAFYQCVGLESITLNEGLLTIGARAFDNCISLPTIGIPSTVSSIGGDVFYSTSQLGTITVDGLNQFYCDVDGILFNKAKTMLVCCPALKDGEITVPGTVETISSGAFQGCGGITAVYLEEGIKEIGQGAFSSCFSLASLYLPNSLERIGAGAFSGCVSITNITLPSSLTVISDSLFFGCGNLEYVFIPANVTSVGSRAFGGCPNLQTIEVDPNNTCLAVQDGMILDLRFNALIQALDSCSGEVVVPAGLRVIKACAFQERSDITRVVFPDSVREIEEYAFAGCTNLQSVSFGFNLLTIGTAAFSDCSRLESIELPQNLSEIGDSAFYGCIAIEAIDLPQSVRSVGQSAFWGCEALSTVTGGAGLRKAGTDAFWETGFIADRDNWEGGGLYLGHVLLKVDTDVSGSYSIKEGTTAIVDSAFADCKLLTSVIIPEGIQEISESCFAGCFNLQEVTLPSGVKSIGAGAFNKWRGQGAGSYEAVWCNINIPATVSYIGLDPFDSFMNVRFEGNPPEACEDAFRDHAWLGFYCPEPNEEWDSVIAENEHDSLGNELEWHRYDLDHIHQFYEVEREPSWCVVDGWVKYQCSSCDESYIEIVEALGHAWDEGIVTTEPTPMAEGVMTYTCMQCQETRTISIPKKQVDPSVFKYVVSDGQVTILKYKGSDPDVFIPSEIEGYPVTAIGPEAFCECGFVTSIDVPSSVTTIGARAFYGCLSLSTISLPNSVTSIDDYVFYDCGLRSIDIPDSVTSIGYRAFMCSDLSAVEIPDSVISIGNEAFSNCDYLVSVSIPDSVKSIGIGAFSNCYSLLSVSIPGSVTSIAHSAFSDCHTLKSVTIADGVTSIGAQSFCYCYALASVDIPNSVTSIGTRAFDGCTSLESVFIPASVSAIGDMAFSGCTSLEAYYVDDENEAFSAVDGVLMNKDRTILHRYPVAKFDPSYRIPDSVVSIDNDAFSSCKYLVNVEVPDTVTSLGKRAFWECYSLQSINIPDALSSIEAYAFYYCTSLDSISIPSSAASIGEYAFYGCFSLTSVEIPSSVTSIGSNAFQSCTSLADVTILGPVSYIGSGAFANLAERSVIYVQSKQIKGNLEGKYDSTRTTVLTDLSSAVVSDVPNQVFSGRAIEPVITVILEGEELVAGTDYNVAFENNVMAGTATLTIFGQGDCTGTVSKTFEILRRDLVDADIASIPSVLFDGKSQEPAVAVSIEDTILVANVDYDVAYANNVSAGIATVTIVGKGNYTGDQIVTFEILKRDIADAEIAPIEDVEYSGSSQEPALAVTYGEDVLVVGTDFDVTFAENINSGTANVTINGVGNYAGTNSATFNILKRDISNAVFASIVDVAFNGLPQEPELTVTYGDDKLTKNVDFTVSYADNVAAGTASVLIVGIGNYLGSNATSFSIMKRDLAEVVISPVADVVYNGSGQKPALTVSFGETALVAGVDYEPVYANNVNAGTATVTIAGKGNYTGTNSSTFNIVKRDIADVVVAPIEDIVFDGTAHEPEIAASVEGRELKSGEDFEVSYADNILPGVAAVVISGKGNYTGSATAEFTILNSPDILAVQDINGNWIKPNGTPYHIVSNADSVFVLDVAKAMPEAGSNVSIWTNNGGANQLFTFEYAPDGNIVLRNYANTALVLDAAGAVPSAGAWNIW